MKKLLCVLLCTSLCFSGFSEEKKCRASSAELASTSAVALSMMAWGIGLVIVIAVVCSVVKNSKA